MTETTINGVSDGVPLKLDDHQSCSKRQKDATSRISQYCQAISEKRTEVSNICFIDFDNSRLLDAEMRQRLPATKLVPDKIRQSPFD